MKKFITTMTVLALSASVLAGCGKTAENGESTQAGTESAAPAETGSETAAAAVEYGEDAYVDGINVADYVTLGEYKGIEVTETTPTVTDDYVQSYIDYALQSNMVTTEVTDSDVQTGDIANIDYEGKIDGVAFEGGTDKGYDLEIGSGSFIDGFEDGLIGAEIGETRDVTVTFPESYPNAEVAGKEAVFTVTVNSIHTESLPDLTDDMMLAESMLKYVIRYVLDNAPEEMAFFNQFVDKGLIERLEHVLTSEFGHVTYTEAIEILEKHNDEFEYKVHWGSDLQLSLIHI